MSSPKKSGYYIVYKAVSPSGKIYIGYTHFSLKDRVKLHFQESNRGTKRPFYYCLRKYGTLVKWEILSTYQTELYAKNREQYFIKKFNSMDKSIGYNCTKGGEGTSGLIRTSQRIPIIDNHGTIYSGAVEVAERLKIERSSVNNAIRHNYWCNGYYFSKYKEGMNKAIEPKTTPKNKKKVLNVTTGKIYESLRDAAKDLNVMEQSISRVLSKKRNLVKGCSLIYYKEV